MTGAGITLYLILAMYDYVLAGVGAAGLFASLIEFHFTLTLISKRDSLITIDETKRTN
jgi:hypothetical protein